MMISVGSIKDREGGAHSREGKEKVYNYLDKLNIFRSALLDETHPRVFKGLSEVSAEALVIIFENSWKKLLEDCKYCAYLFKKEIRWMQGIRE